MNPDETRPADDRFARSLRARIDELGLTVADTEWPVVLEGARWLDAAARRVEAEDPDGRRHPAGTHER